MGLKSPSMWGSPLRGGALPGGCPDRITGPFSPTRRRLHEAQGLVGWRHQGGPDLGAGEVVLRQWEDRRQGVSRHQPGEQPVEPACRPLAAKSLMRNGAVLSSCPVDTLNRHCSSDNVLEDETAARSDIWVSLLHPAREAQYTHVKLIRKTTPQKHVTHVSHWRSESVFCRHTGHWHQHGRRPASA